MPVASAPILNGTTTPAARPSIKAEISGVNRSGSSGRSPRVSSASACAVTSGASSSGRSQPQWCGSRSNKLRQHQAGLFNEPTCWSALNVDHDGNRSPGGRRAPGEGQKACHTTGMVLDRAAIDLIGEPARAIGCAAT